MLPLYTGFSLILLISQCKADVAGCFIPPSNGTCLYEDITFWLYTRTHTEGVNVQLDNLQTLPVEKDKSWKVLFHGYNGSRNALINVELTKAYFKRDNYNILIIDYKKPYYDPTKMKYCYPIIAVYNVDYVGKCVAERLEKLIHGKFLPTPDKLHFIGHSLGAHTAANVAYYLKLTNNYGGNGVVERLTGLDPAGPFFSTTWRNLSQIIDQTDAIFVDVYHTNNNDFGMVYNIAHVDVIFNGGEQQPGCNNETHLNHNRAVEYYAESILPVPPNNLKFYGILQNTTHRELIGEDISTALRGIFDVTTNDKSPFAQG